MKHLYRVLFLLISTGVITYIGIEFKLNKSIPETLSLVCIIFLSFSIGFYVGRYEKASLMDAGIANDTA